MRIDILTLFPGICSGPLSESMMKRAREAGLVRIDVHDIRNWSRDKHRTTDSPPYGGGAGMVMRPEPVFDAVESLRSPESRILLMTPQGRSFRQTDAVTFSKLPHLIILCAHYEGIDHRVVEHLVDEEISIGDYILTNGAIAACVVVDALVRLIPGVLGEPDSAVHESFSTGILEGPQYTRPPEFRGWKVPEILLSGNHGEIEKWRHARALERTARNRPDLLNPES